MDRKRNATLFAMAIAVSAVACGEASVPFNPAQTPTADFSPLPEADLRGVLHRQLNDYAHALLDQDQAALSTILSTERLGRVMKIADLGAYAENEKRLLMHFLDGQPFSEFQIEEVHAYEEQSVVAVRASHEGQPVSKLIYFVAEAGEFKFSGQAPRSTRFRVSEQGSPFGQAVSPIEGNEYTIYSSDSTATVSFRCMINGAWSPEWSISPQTYAYRTCDDQCGWFDGGKFQGKNEGIGSPFEDEQECDYNTFGIDYYYNGVKWNCTDKCG